PAVAVDGAANPKILQTVERGGGHRLIVGERAAGDTEVAAGVVADGAASAATDHVIHINRLAAQGLVACEGRIGDGHGALVEQTTSEDVAARAGHSLILAE